MSSHLAGTPVPPANEAETDDPLEWFASPSACVETDTPLNWFGSSSACVETDTPLDWFGSSSLRLTTPIAECFESVEVSQMPTDGDSIVPKTARVRFTTLAESASESSKALSVSPPSAPELEREKGQTGSDSHDRYRTSPSLVHNMRPNSGNKAQAGQQVFTLEGHARNIWHSLIGTWFRFSPGR